MRRFMAVALMLLVAAGSAAAAGPDEKVVKKIRQSLKSVKNLSATLEQQFYWKVLDKTQGTTGSIMLAKPDRFRIELEDMTMVCDGKWVWRYSPANKQVLKSALKNSPEIPDLNRFVFDFEKNYRVEDIRDEKGKYHVLSLVPLAEDEGLRGLTIWVDTKELLIRKINFADANQNETTYILTHVKVNRKLKGDEFAFTAPEGVEIFETD